MQLQTLVKILIPVPLVLGAGTGIQPAGTGKILEALRIPNASVQVDGRLDEPVWKISPTHSGFIQRDPQEGAQATEKTEFAVLFDDQYLYVGIRAHAREPEKIRAILGRRDEESPSDWLYVSLDSYNDNRTAFDFWLNPLGVKRDQRRFDDSNIDSNWDALWDGQAARDEQGWSAEFKIPFRELRFANHGSQSWGIQVYRYIAANNEHDYWTHWGKEEVGWVRHYGELTGIDELPRQRRFYVAPYLTGRINRAPYYRNPVHPEPYDLDSNLGADIKIGLTNNLTLDLALNPDFGQVEADPAELNLSAFETYFPEKRPFFVEGGNIFNFGLGIGDGDQAYNSLFYTRRIGRRPHDYASDETGYETNPTATRILAAGKLSGKTSAGWSLGLMNAVTAREVGIIAYEDRESVERTIEPLTNYFVTRMQKDFRQGRTAVGGMFTAANRNLQDAPMNYLIRDAYSAGLDINHTFLNDEYYLEAALAGTQVLGSREALLETQTGPSHYYQRPDATHLEVDSTATTLTGFAHKFALGKMGGEHWRYLLGEMSTSPGFEPNDLGFNRETDSRTAFIWAQYREDDPGPWIRRWNLNFNLWQTRSYGPEAADYGGNLNANLTFSNYWNTGAGLNHNLGGWHRHVLWGGPSLRVDRTTNAWFNLRSDSRRRISIGLFANRGGQSSGTRWFAVDPGLTWRPTDNFSVRTNLGYQVTDDNWSTWSDYGPTPDLQNPAGNGEYLIADLLMKTLSLTLRFDLTLSPEFTVQYYGSPYITSGKYRNHKLVAEPRAGSYDRRFRSFDPELVSYDPENRTWCIDSDGDGITNFEIADYDFNYKQFNSNLVLRWEYRTGTTLYLVWSQNLAEYLETGSFDFARDLRELWAVDVENILLLKFSYLLNI